MSFMDKSHPKMTLDLIKRSDNSPHAQVSVYPHFARARSGQEPRYQGGSDAYWVCPNVGLVAFSDASVSLTRV
jgi:hypothetical protein